LLDYLTEAVVPYNEDGNTVTISSCAGVFIIPEGYQFNHTGDIMEKIIPACRLAQDGKQGNIVFYNEKMVSAKEKTMRVQQQFPKALKNHEFQVFYQPKVNTMTGELCGAEALCRWFRKGKLVPPMEFIPVLEQTTDICKLDFYMLEMVCQHIRKWLDEGRKVVRVSVNLSRKHMMDSRLLETIIDIISRYQVPHEYIEIELTETTTDVEFKDLQRIVGGLQEESIYTAVDDFGMGYSSLNLIRVIPWNVLKVDRSFLPLDGEQENSVRNIMFRYVVAMAKEMGLECIVEGVETPAQLEVLRKNHCELAQGFLFDKPLPLDEFEKRLDMQVYPIEMKTAS
ncbi:MAG TPA: GGDEF domain-containing protein, partial [Ruminococcus sp.]|nr:GGDEF domain-containing protein [Ruminococcus sp.]